MKIPQGMTKEQVLKTIYELCDIFKRKYVVDIYDMDDIYQEAFMLCIEALERYDSSKPLQNFLSIHLRNRLFNLRRNVNIKSIDAVSIPETFDIEERNKVSLILELENIIDERLDAETRQDYLRMKDGMKIPLVRSRKLKKKLKELYKNERE